MNDARSRWEQQERDRLARDIGPDRADEWISVLRDLATAAHGTELVTIWDAIRFALDARNDAGNPHPRGDSSPGTPDLAGLITDLALVLDGAMYARAPAESDAALIRLAGALGGITGQTTDEIGGRLAVALARAQAQGEPAPRGDSDPVRRAAQRLTADLLRIIPAGQDEDWNALSAEIQRVAEIWIESAWNAAEICGLLNATRGVPMPSAETCELLGYTPKEDRGIMTDQEISEIADDAASLNAALLARGFGVDAMTLTAAAMPVIVSTVLGTAGPSTTPQKGTRS